MSEHFGLNQPIEINLDAENEEDENEDISNGKFQNPVLGMFLVLILFVIFNLLINLVIILFILLLLQLLLFPRLPFLFLLMLLLLLLLTLMVLVMPLIPGKMEFPPPRTTADVNRDLAEEGPEAFSNLELVPREISG